MRKKKISSEVFFTQDGQYIIMKGKRYRLQEVECTEAVKIPPTPVKEYLLEKQFKIKRINGGFV